MGCPEIQPEKQKPKHELQLASAKNDTQRQRKRITRETLMPTFPKLLAQVENINRLKKTKMRHACWTLYLVRFQFFKSWVRAILMATILVVTVCCEHGKYNK